MPESLPTNIAAREARAEISGSVSLHLSELAVNALYVRAGRHLARLPRQLQSFLEANLM